MTNRPQNENPTRTRPTSANRRFRRMAASVLSLTLVSLLALQTPATAGLLDTVSSKVNEIVNRVKQIQGNANLIPTIKNKINALPTNDAIANLIQKLDPKLVGDLMSAVDGAKEAIEFLNDQRDGFVDFKNGSGVTNMRSDLKDVLADAKTLADAGQRLRCMRNPDANLIPADGNLGNGVIDKLPPVALYSLKKTLDEVDPDWPDVFSKIISKLPTEFTDDGSNVCEELRNDFEMTRCGILRLPALQPRRMADIGIATGAAADLLRIVKDLAPEEVEFTLTVVALGGGGAGTSIRLPLHGALEAGAVVMDGISDGMDRLGDEQDKCDARDDVMERDLLSCTALASYDRDLRAVRDLAVRRLETLETTTISELNEVEWTETFGELCTRYQEIRML